VILAASGSCRSEHTEQSENCQNIQQAQTRNVKNAQLQIKQPNSLAKNILHKPICKEKRLFMVQYFEGITISKKSRYFLINRMRSAVLT